MQIQAPVALSLVLKHYLFLEVTADSIKKYRLFSNGNTGLVFTLNEDLKQSKINSHKVPKTFVFGQITSAMDLELMPKAKIVVVVFQPYGLQRLTCIPSKELKGTITEASYIFDNSIVALQNAIIEASNQNQIISRLNMYFQGLFFKQAIRSSPLVPQIIDKIIKSKGSTTLQNIKDEFFLHERKLQRLFADQVGISPKKFIQIAKLHSFIGHITAKSRNATLTPAVFEAGYYDQAHLIKDFKNITGMTPTQYRNSPTLAVNLVALS